MGLFCRLFKIIDILMLFQSDGTELWFSEAEKSSLIQGDTSIARVFSNLVGIRSGPEDLVGSRSLSTLAIPDISKFIDGIS